MNKRRRFRSMEFNSNNFFSKTKEIPNLTCAATRNNIKIKDLVEIYSRKINKGSSRILLRPELNLLKPKTPKVVELASPSSSLVTPPSILSILSTLQLEILEVKSDKLELERDLSTYEYNFSQACNLKQKLNRLFSIKLPLLEFSSNSLKEQEDKFKKTFINSISALQMPKEKKRERICYKEELNIRKITIGAKISHIMTCVRNISGVETIINIYSDAVLSKFIINLSLPSRIMLCYQTKFPLSIFNTKDTEEIHKKIRKKILPFLYFNWEKGGLSVKWSEKYKKTFINLLVSIKGLVYPVMFELTEDVTNWSILLQITNQILHVSRKKLPNESIFKTSEAVLKNIIKNHVVFDPENMEISWVHKNKEVFKRRESLSKLMSMKYVYSALGCLPFEYVDEKHMAIDERIYKVSIMFYTDIEKIEISNEERVERIDLNSNLGEWIRNLQFSSFRVSPGTLFRSLELKQAIRFLFNHKWIDLPILKC